MALADVKARVFHEISARTVRSGRPPRRSDTHYFIEAEGLHSRIHLQNFWSTFWPDETAGALAKIHAYSADGQPVAQREVTLPRFGSMFLEMRDLLDSAPVTEGSVAIDLEPPAQVRRRFADLPAPELLQVNTPFWMAYYDDDENYMYVHSIDTLGGAVSGANAPLRWMLGRAPAVRVPWRSWRLLDVALLDELQVVVANQDIVPGSTQVGVHEASGETLWSRQVSLRPRQLERVVVPADEIASWRAERPSAHVRIGVEPLLSANGKPYVIMRYGGGPLSLHHG